MNISLKGTVVGALALAGAILATGDAEAMPVGPVAVPAAAAQLDQVYWYGYRRPFVRRFYYGYRPFYGYRRFGYYRRPFFGYGFRRGFYGRRFY